MRTIVHNTSPRCGSCRMPPRWCVCAGHREIACPLQVDVLVHHREWFRPSSTGGLINRVIAGSRRHLWRRERQLAAADVRVPGRDMWILHPHGEAVPDAVAPHDVQILLLDGSWSETSAMAQEVSSWGRLVSLPMQGESRYWLRAQQDGGRFSTVEALIWLLEHLGLADAGAALRLQFELHVYAGLRARGRIETAARYLQESPLVASLPELLVQMNTRRPR